MLETARRMIATDEALIESSRRALAKSKQLLERARPAQIVKGARGPAARKPSDCLPQPDELEVSAEEVATNPV